MANILSMASSVFAYLNRPPKCDIILYDDLTYENVVFPVIPADLPPVEQAQANEVFSGASGDITLIGPLGLRGYKLDNILLPVNKSYSFLRPNASDGEDIIDFIKMRRETKQVFRICVIFTDGNELLNMACVCDNLSYYYDKLHDIHASIDFKEYIYVNTTNDKTTNTSNSLSDNQNG